MLTVVDEVLVASGSDCEGDGRVLGLVAKYWTVLSASVRTLTNRPHRNMEQWDEMPNERFGE